VQNYPDPFNPSTTIRYSLQTTSMVKLAVYNPLGKEVAILVNKEQPSGTYKINFDAKNLSSGMYIYKIQAGDFSDVKKMLLPK